MPRFLHVGCGRKRKAQTIQALNTPEWEEVTLDIDESVDPDIVDKLPELAKVPPDSFDVVYSSHSIEHLYPHEVPVALMAFHRVLKSDGIVIIRCPDLQAIGERLASGDLETPIYDSSLGPVAPIDMLYGFRASLQQGNLYMAHHTGFTSKTLTTALQQAGFKGCITAVGQTSLELWGVGTKYPTTAEAINKLLKICLTPL